MLHVFSRMSLFLQSYNIADGMHCMHTLSISRISAVCGFEVKHGPAARELDLRVDNTELLDCAALTGENRTAEITRESQLVISQHGVFLSLDCSSLLPAPSPGRPPPTVMWTRQSQPSRWLCMAMKIMLGKKKK